MDFPNAHLTQFGQNVRRLREKKQLTQEALAERVGLHTTYISGIERGVRNPSLLSLVRVAKGLGVKIGEICKGVEA